MGPKNPRLPCLPAPSYSNHHHPTIFHSERFIFPALPRFLLREKNDGFCGHIFYSWTPKRCLVMESWREDLQAVSTRGGPGSTFSGFGSGRVWTFGYRVGFYPTSKFLLGSGRVILPSGRVFGFSGTRSAPTKQIQFNFSTYFSHKNSKWDIFWNFKPVCPFHYVCKLKAKIFSKFYRFFSKAY